MIGEVRAPRCIRDYIFGVDVLKDKRKLRRKEHQVPGMLDTAVPLLPLFLKHNSDNPRVHIRAGGGSHQTYTAGGGVSGITLRRRAASDVEAFIAAPPLVVQQPVQYIRENLSKLGADGCGTGSRHPVRAKQAVVYMRGLYVRICGRVHSIAGPGVQSPSGRQPHRGGEGQDHQ